MPLVRNRDTKKEMRNPPTIYLIGIIAILIGIIIAFFVLVSQNILFPNSGTISGQFDINGVVPEGSTITLLQKETQSEESSIEFAKNISPIDHATWTFPDAIPGKSYEIQAKLMQSGKLIGLSDSMSVTAPGQDVVLTINVGSDEAHESEQVSGDAILSGTVGINGYIPPESTISVEGRTLGKSDFTVVAANLPGKDSQFMSYTTAVAGRTYEVRGILYDASGQQIGTSNILTVTAPALNEAIHINSTAKAPVTPVSQQTSTTTRPTNSIVSGSITFNGQAPSNSRIVILYRPSGQGSYQVAVDNITPQNGASWTWKAAKASTWYDMVAVLKKRQSNGTDTDTDISDSNTITLAAPASNEVFIINSGFTLPPASGSISVSCGNFSNNTWNASISFQTIQGAASYWYQIGTTNGGTDIQNFTQNATNNQSQSFNQTLQNGTTYYARYAYANVQNLSADSPQFSPFSQTTQLRCSQ